MATPDEIKKWRAQFTSLLNDQNVLSNTGNNSLLSMLNDAKSVGLADDSFIQKYRTFRQARLDWARSQPIPNPQTGQPLFKVNARKQTVPVTGSDLFVNGEFRPDLGLRGVKAAREERMKGLQAEADADVKRLGGIAEALAPSSPLGNIGMGLQAVTEAVRSIPTTGRLAASGLTGGFIAPPSATQIRDTMVQKPFEDVLAMTPEQARLEAMKPARAGGFAFGEGFAPTIGGIVGGQAAGTGLALSGLAAGPLAPVAVPAGYFLGSLGGAFLAGKAQEWLLKNAYGDKAYTEQIAPLFGQALQESGTAGMAGSFGNVLLQGSPVLSSGIGARRTLALAKAAWTGKPVTLQGTLDELGMAAANRAESVDGALLPNIVARVQPGSKYEAVVSPLLDRFASAGKQVAEANRYKLFSPQSTGLGGRMVEFGKFVQQTPGASDFVGDLIGEQFGNLGQSAYDYMQAVKKSKETGEPVNTAEMLANLAFGSLFIGNNRFTDSISRAAGTIGGGAVEAISRIPVVGEPVEALQRRYSEQNKGLLAGLLREPAVQDVRAGIPTAYQERMRPRQRLTAATETRQALAPEQVAVALGGGEAVVFNKNTGEAQPRVSFNELFGAIDDTATVQQGQGISEALSNIPTERSGRYLDRLSAFGGRDIIPQVGQFRQQVVGLSKSMDSDTGHVIVREQVEDINPLTGKPDTVAQYRALRLSDLEAGNQSLAEELLRSAGLAPSNEIYGGAIVAPEFLNEGDLDSPFSVLAAWQRSMAFQGGLPENVWREFPTVVSFDRGVELATRIVGVEKNGDLQVQILSPTMDIVRVSGENVQERRGERTTTQQLDPVSLSDLLNEADISDLAVPKPDTTADVFANPDSGIHAVAFDADTILPIQLTKEQRARIPAMADALNNAVNQAVRDGGANAGKSARKRFIANGLRSLFGGNTLPSSGYDYEVGSTLLADRPSGQEWGVVLRNTEAGPLVAFPSNDLKPVVVQDSDVKESSRTKREGERPSVDSAYDEAVAIDRLGGEDGGTAALQLAQSLLDQYGEDPERFLGVESLAEILSMTESKGKIIGDKQEAIDRFNKIVDTLNPAIDGTEIEDNIRELFGFIEEAINNASFVKPLNAKALEGRTVDEYKGMDRVDINAGLSSIKSPLDKAKYLVGQILRMGEKLSDESQISSVMERLFGIEVKDNVATGNLSTVLKRAEVYRDKIAEVAKSKDSDLIEQANQAIDTLDRLVAMAESFKFSGRRVSAGVRRTSSVKTIDDYAAVSSLDPSVILTEYRETKAKARAFTGIIERVRKAIKSGENLDPMVEILGFGKVDGVYTLSDNPKLKEPWIGNPETSQWQYVVKRFNGIKSALVTATSVDLDNIDRFNAAVDYLDTVIEPALAQQNADGSIKFKYSGKPIKEDEDDAQAQALRERAEAQAARAMTEKQIAAIRGSNPYTRNADGDLVPVVIKGGRRTAGTRFAVGSQGKRNLAQEVVELTYRSIADGTDLALTSQQQAVRDALEMPDPDANQEWYRSAMQGISFLNDNQIRGIISNIGYAVLENKGDPLTLDSEFKFRAGDPRPLNDTEKSILSDAGWVLADGVIDKSGVKIYGASERGYRYGTVLNQTSESETGDPEEAVSRLFGLPAVDGEMDLDFTEIRATDKLSFGNALVSAYAKTKAGKGKKKEAIEKDFAPVVELFDTIIHGVANRKVDMLLDGIEVGAFSTRRSKEEVVSATRKQNMLPHSIRPMYDELQPMYQRLRELLGLEKNADIVKTLAAGGDRAKEVRAAIAQLVEETAEDFYMNRMPTIADFQVIPEVKNKMGQYLKIYDEASGVSTKVIMAYKAATIDTFVHEIAHAIFEELPYALKYEISSALGHKLRVPTLLHDSVITYEAQEKFAYGLELALANMSRLEQPWAGVNVSKDRKFSGPLLDVLLGAASVVEGTYTALTSARANNREIRKIFRKGSDNEVKQLFERDWKIPYIANGRVYLWFKAPVIIDAAQMRKDLKGDSPDAVALRQVLGKNEELRKLLDDGIPYFYARIGSQFGTTKNGSRLVPLLLDSSEQLEMKITRDLVRDLGDEIFPNIPNKYVAYIGGPTDGLTTTVMQTLSSWMSEKRSGLGRQGIISATRVEREKRLIRNESGRIIDVNRENLPWNESKLGERNDVRNIFAQLGIMPTTDTEFTVVTALLGNRRIQKLTDRPTQSLRNYHKNRVGWILNPDNKDAYDFTVAAAYARLLGRLGRVSKDKNQSPDRRDRAKDLYDAALNNNPDPDLIEALAAFEQVMHGNRFVRDSVQSQINAIRKGTTFAQWRILETTHKTPFEGLPKLKFDRIKQTVIIGHFKDPRNPDFAEEVFKVNLRNGQVFKFDPRSKQFNDLEYGLSNTIIIPEATLPAVADSDSGLIKTLRRVQPFIKSTFLEQINDDAKKAFQGIRLGESSQVYRPEFYIANALVEKALETGKFVGEGEATPVERMGPAELFFYDPKTYPLDDVTDLAQMSLPEDDDNAEGVRRLRVQVSALHGAGMRAVDMAYRAALSDYAKGQFNDFNNKIAYGHDTVVLNELLAAFDGLENKWQVTFMPAVFNGDAKPTLMGHGVINENETYKVLGRAALLGQKFGQPNVFVTEETKSEDFGLKKDGYIVVPAVSYKLSKPIDHVQFRKFVDTNPGVYNGALLSQTESGEQLMTLFMVPGSDIGRSESKAWTDMVREGIEDYFNESQSASTKQGEVIRAEHEADEKLRLWNLGSSEFGGLGAYQEYEEVLGILRANAPDDALPDVWQNKSSATIDEINVAFRREVERGMSIALGRDIVLPSRIQVDASVGPMSDLALYLSEYRASHKDTAITDVRVLDAYMALQDALLKQYHALNVKFDFMPEKKVDGQGFREVLVRTPDGKVSFEEVPYGFENPYGVDYDTDDLSKGGWLGFNEFQRNAALDIHTERHLYIFKTGTPEMYSGKTKVANLMMERSPIRTESGEPMLWMDLLYAINNVLSNGIYSSDYRRGKGLGYIQSAYSVHAMLTDDPWAMWALANELLVRRSAAVNMLYPEMPPNYALAYREINPDSTDGEWRSIQEDLATVSPSLPPLDFMYAGINQVDDRVRLFANQLRMAPAQLKQGADSGNGFSRGVPSYGPYNGTLKHIHETRGSRKLGGYEPIFDSDLTVANGNARQVELRDGSKYWMENHDNLVAFAVKSIKHTFTGQIHRALQELANGQSVIVSPSDWARMSAESTIELRIKPGQAKAGRIKDKKRRPGFNLQYTEPKKTASLLFPNYADDLYSTPLVTREIGPDQWLAAAAALVWEIENKGKLIDKPMYRGADLWAMDKTHGIAEFSTADYISENFAISQDFQHKKGYSIIEFPPNSLKAIKAEDYSSEFVTEEGYIVLTLDYQGYKSETRMPSMRASQLQTRNHPVISVPSPEPGAGASKEAAASMQAMITQVMAPVKGVDFKDIMFIADPDADRGAVEVNLPTMTVVGNFTKDQLDWVRRYRQQGNEGVSFFNINTTDPAEIIKQFYGDIDDDVIDMAQSTMDVDDDVIDMAQSSMPSASATTTTTGTTIATGRASVNPLLRAVFALNQIMRAGASGDASPILMQNFIQANLLENPDMMMRQIKLIGQILRNPNMGVEIRLSNGNTITRGSMAGRKFFDEVLESEVRSRRNYDEAVKAGLSLAAITRQKALDDLKLKKPNATYADIDELGYNSDAGSDVEFLKHMPGQGLSERYFALSKDIVKMNTWDQMVKTLVELGYNPTPWKYELDPATGQQRVVHTTWTRALVDLAHLLNVTAGDIRFVDDDDTDERIARLGKLMFFAPRWLTSRLILNGWGRTMIEFAGSRFGKDGENWAHRVLAVNGMSRGQLARRSSAVAAIHGRLMYKAYMQWLALILGIYALGATNPHTMKVSVEGSLTKFQIGDYSFRAPGAIMAQVELTAAVLDAMNAFNAQTPGPQAKSKLEMVWESVSRVLMSRASPVVSLGAEVLTGKDAFGEPAFIPDEAVDRFYSEVIQPSLSAAGITEPKDMKINRSISRRMMWWWIHDMMELYDAERKVGVTKADALLKSTALGAYSGMGGRVSFLSNRLKWEREAMQRMQATPGIDQIFTGATPEPEIDGLYTEVDENQPTEVPMPFIGAISADYNEELPGYDPYNQPLR